MRTSLYLVGHPHSPPLPENACDVLSGGELRYEVVVPNIKMQQRMIISIIMSPCVAPGDALHYPVIFSFDNTSERQEW